MSKAWWRAALVRALRTICQTAVGLLGTGAVGLLEADWLGVLSCAAMAGVISILTSLGGLPEVDGGAED